MSTDAFPSQWIWEPKSQRFLPLENNQLDFPTALLWGYSVFTSFRYPLPKQWVNAHLERLFHHAQKIGYGQHDPNQVLEGLKEIISSDPFNQLPSPCSVRLTLYPDVDHFQTLIQPLELQKSDWKLLLSYFPAPTLFTENVLLVVQRYQRPLSEIKHGNYLQEFLLLQTSQPHTGQALDILRLNTDNNTLEEASTSNLFLIHQDESGQCSLLTPHQNCLKGILQQEVIDWAVSQGLTATRKSATIEDLRQASGVFLSNSGSLLKSVSHWRYFDSPDTEAIHWSSEAQQFYQGLKASLLLKIERH